MVNAVLVMAGGGLGALCRYGSVNAAARLFGDAMPWGTAFVNILGCFLIGLAAGAMEKTPFPRQYWLLFVTGFLGGFTTFSSFALDSASLARAGGLLGLGRALANVGLNLAGGLAAAAAGLALALKAF